MKKIMGTIKGILDNHPAWMMLIAAVVGAGLMLGIEGDDITELVGLTAGAVSAMLGVCNFIRTKAKTGYPNGEGTKHESGISESERTDTETESEESGSGTGGMSSGSDGC